jgi:hypothetical protein
VYLITVTSAHRLGPGAAESRQNSDFSAGGSIRAMKIIRAWRLVVTPALHSTTPSTASDEQQNDWTSRSTPPCKLQAGGISRGQHFNWRQPDA